VRRFALTGLAGYIASRHLKAIKEVGGSLVAALDPATSVGIVDSYFPEAAFFFLDLFP
jgi:UDP-N-acetyl-2-amino-2-deoxyglucuronate dehydrogenase